MEGGVPQDASDVAYEALRSSSVSAGELQEWERILIESGSGRPAPGYKVEGYAYAEAVRADVRSALQAAGYPDHPTRVIEVYSESRCSKSS